jgi:hypothetical protein
MNTDYTTEQLGLFAPEPSAQAEPNTLNFSLEQAHPFEAAFPTPEPPRKEPEAVAKVIASWQFKKRRYKKINRQRIAGQSKPAPGPNQRRTIIPYQTYYTKRWPDEELIAANKALEALEAKRALEAK